MQSRSTSAARAIAEFIEHERGAIAVSHASRMDGDPQRQADGVDKRVNLAPSHFLSGVVAGQTVMAAPFSADFND
jgi:hypothetical protein